MILVNLLYKGFWAALLEDLNFLSWGLGTWLDLIFLSQRALSIGTSPFTTPIVEIAGTFSCRKASSIRAYFSTWTSNLQSPRDKFLSMNF